MSGLAMTGEVVAWLEAVGKYEEVCCPADCFRVKSDPIRIGAVLSCRRPDGDESDPPFCPLCALRCMLIAALNTFSPSCSPPILNAVSGRTTIGSGFSLVGLESEASPKPTTDDIRPTRAARTIRRRSLEVSRSYSGLSTPDAPAATQASIVESERAEFAEYARMTGTSTGAARTLAC